MAQQVKTLFGMQASMLLRPSYLADGDGSSIWILALLVRDLDGVRGFWLWAGSALPAADLGSEQAHGRCSSVSPSTFKINTFLSASSKSYSGH